MSANINAKKAEIQKLLDTIKPPLKAHLPALSVRISQLVQKDHYGVENRTDWLAEIDYFILNILCGGNSRSFEALKRSSHIGTSYDRIVRIIDYTAQNWTSVTSREGVAWSELSPLGFETECAKVLSSVGWQTRTTSGSGDQGIDIIATSNRFKLVVQCKRYADSVGNGAVQEIIAGKEYEKAQFSAVISTGEFTRSAYQLAASGNVMLLHPSQIADKLEAAKFDPNAIVGAPQEIIEDVDGWLDSIPEALASFEAKHKNQSKDDLEEADYEEDEEMGDDEELMQSAIDIIKSSRGISTSTIQRRLRIGYNRAARIMDELEQKGIIGPENGSNPREILVDFNSL
jgi:ribosomal protein S25